VTIGLSWPCVSAPRSSFSTPRCRPRSADGQRHRWRRIGERLLSRGRPGWAKSTRGRRQTSSYARARPAERSGYGSIRSALDPLLPPPPHHGRTCCSLAGPTWRPCSESSVTRIRPHDRGLRPSFDELPPEGNPAPQLRSGVGGGHRQPPFGGRRFGAAAARRGPPPKRALRLPLRRHLIPGYPTPSGASGAPSAPNGSYGISRS